MSGGLISNFTSSYQYNTSFIQLQGGKRSCYHGRIQGMSCLSGISNYTTENVSYKHDNISSEYIDNSVLQYANLRQKLHTFHSY